MFIIAHLFIGLIIGNLTNNYIIALIFAVLIDLDHLIPYIKHKIIFKPKKLWEAITDPIDHFGNQRNYLHSFFTWAIVTIIVFFINPKIVLVLSLAYLSHLILDMLDGSDFYPLYPIKFNIKGPVGYLSKYELISTLLLIIIFLILIL